MKEVFDKYIKDIGIKFSYDETSEMGYRSDFEKLLSEVFSTINVKRIDHDAKAQKGNKPDFVILKHEVPILYIEVKAVGVSLDQIEKSDQMSRYFGYENLVLTDYVEFRFYRNGVQYEEPIKLAEIDKKSKTLKPYPENYDRVAKTLLDFTQSHKEQIKSGAHLAKIMGGKAQRVRDNVVDILENKKSDEEIIQVYNSIKELLIHDLSLGDFADLYAQTLVYGLFVARHHDPTSEDFTRQEARDLIPSSNPFLRNFFDHIAGTNFEKRLEYIVDELCTAFVHSDVKKLMEQHYGVDLWGEKHEGPDPVIHFYEDFLKEYDPSLRKKMGAYYTPTPVVRFIVKSINQILEEEFDLKAGLADKTKHDNGTHRVQVLDPAVGTGTFISAVIRQIYEYILKTGQKGSWPSYVHNDLLPRLHGFELMMAPYTIAHLKLSSAFEKTGFKYFNKRLGIYLTNSLESTELQSSFDGFGLSKSISTESHEAAKIKNETPIMVVLGNPPYSGISSNETEYANSLVDKYKYEPGGKVKLQERKHWLNDDYVKFISLAETKIAETGEGVVGMITSHGYLDNPTFRGMRWHLMKTFDKIFVLDLHGNSNKKETTPDGGKDENVFNIKTGVSIILAIRRKGADNNKELAEVYRSDLYGKQKEKLQALKDSSWKDLEWVKINPQPSHYYFTSYDDDADEEYKKFKSVSEIFPVNVTGIVTMGDNFALANEKEQITERLYSLKDEKPSVEKFKSDYGLGKNYGKWLLNNLNEIKIDENKVVRIAYRPFDIRWTYFDNKVIWRWRGEIMHNYLSGDNLGLMLPKQNKKDWGVLVTKTISAHKTVSAYDINYNFPLYVYTEDGDKKPNIDTEFIDQLEGVVGKVSPEDVLDYTYALLSCSNYQDKYKEFLKNDFPRIPIPKNKENFDKLVQLGNKLRKLHLFEADEVNDLKTTFPEVGTNKVEKVIYKDQKVWINDKQYFGNVPEFAWNYRIGGYEPAQKWLKDRKDLELNNEEIEYWQKIVVSLLETDQIIKEINEVYEK